MLLIFNILTSSQYVFFQILIVSCIGSLLGEFKVTTLSIIDIKIKLFILNWFMSWFAGMIIGLLLNGTISKQNSSITIAGAGLSSFIGHKKALGIAENIFNNIITIPKKEEEKNKKFK